MRYLTLSVDAILPALAPMREALDPLELEELADDIRRRGMLSPLLVSPEADPSGLARWRLVAGARRLAAAKLAGLLEVPCLEHALGEVDQVTAMLSENLKRTQPNPVDEARVFAILRETTEGTLQELATLVGKSTSYVQSRLALLSGPADVFEAVRQGLVNLSVALEIGKCVHDGDRAFLLSHAVSSGATAGTARLWVKDAETQRARMPESPPSNVVAFPAPAPAVITYVCEWCRKTVPLETTIAFRVCGDDYQFLQQLRTQVEQADDARARHAAETGREES